MGVVRMEADAAAVTALQPLLGEFFNAREPPDGLGQSFRHHQSWLTTQAWYHFETAKPDQFG